MTEHQSLPEAPLSPLRHQQVRAMLVREAAGTRRVRAARGSLPILIGAPLAVGAIVVGIGLTTGPGQSNDRVTSVTAAAARPTPTATKPGVAYDIPDSVGFTKADLPADQKSSGDNDVQYADSATVDGQYCEEEGAHGPRPIAGRMWSWWAGNGTTQVKARTVDLVVTGWKSDTGAANFADVVQNTGYCVFTGRVKAAAGVEVAGADETWAGTRSVNGLRYGYVVVRVGDLIGAVTVQDHHGKHAALVTAERLAGLAAERLRKVEP
jgi:hypothetical protein